MAMAPLTPQQLHTACELDLIPYQTTTEVVEQVDVVGQERALAALEFGTGIRRDGYNLFVLGTPGAGRHGVVRRFLERRAAGQATPPDWCYVHNFEQPHRPRALRFAPGQGRRFCEAMAQLVEELHSTLPGAFEGDEYQARRRVVEQEFKDRHEQAIDETRERARGKDIALITTPGGFAFAPLSKGEVMSPAAFHKLPEDDRKRIEGEIEQLEQELAERLRRLPAWQKEARGRIRELNREVALGVVQPAFAELKASFADTPGVPEYLDAACQDVVENVGDFTAPREDAGPRLPFAPEPTFTRYQVNLLIQPPAGRGAPVVYADLPNYPNLVGRLDHQARFGTLSTDFTLIKPGALHEANGGYLLLDAMRLLSQPYAWDAMKRALRAKELRIEPLERAIGLLTTVSLDPEPIPLDVTVLLIGDRRLYYLLAEYDPEFVELFKVAADFEDDLRRSPDITRDLARLLATLANRQGLLPFGAAAVARVIEHASRSIGDAQRVDVRLNYLGDLLTQADYFARQVGETQVAPDHVQTAIDAAEQRSGRVRERVQEAILRDTLLIDTAGERVGQINGLAVLGLGSVMFGRPSRITARVRPGQGRVLDIEREVELGGPLHSKGVLILSSFLAARYSTGEALSLSASLVFEQSYSGVDGDSASCAELYALLSALADAPIRQSLAVTGSVNQFGEVQAIGGVNEKIEGFFDICKARGLAGNQGVLIPASNVQHLMLRAEVRDAVATGQFHVYAVRTVDEGIELLTGLPAGVADTEGIYPEGSINGLVSDRLAEYARIRAALAHGGENNGNGDG
ncbi:Lon protease family protein [Immundisolibacter sp.]|uniref:Lon protease family protein n=1 Tax=Immundisolibacter sp. TaxID=1934948 RepID=UPI0035613403